MSGRLTATGHNASDQSETGALSDLLTFPERELHEPMNRLRFPSVAHAGRPVSPPGCEIGESSGAGGPGPRVRPPLLADCPLGPGQGRSYADIRAAADVILWLVGSAVVVAVIGLGLAWIAGWATH